MSAERVTPLGTLFFIIRKNPFALVPCKLVWVGPIDEVSDLIYIFDQHPSWYKWGL